MKKFISIFTILSLVIFTTIIKNSTKNLDSEIFSLKEELRLLENKYELILLDYNYLTSPKKLLEYSKTYFDQELRKKNINEIKILRLSNVDIIN
tara:strand:+ start:467 stop:748 length:282 start_codon:yes stop_codon:yes gene_type:complete